MGTTFLRGRGSLLKNWLSAAGAVLATSAFFAFLLLFAIDIFGRQRNPYMGLLAYVVAPGFLLLGLLMIFVGFYVQRRQVRKAGAAAVIHPLIIDLSRPRDRLILNWFLGAAVVFLLITAIGVTRTYHYTESIHFCGQACHGPMKPEFTTYLISPHARVDCVDCHVGSGATYYLKAKLNGVHQLIGTITDSHHRPITTPVKNLRPAKDTCEQCHWPGKVSGNLDRTYTHFLSDETNTPFSVRLLLTVGGPDTAPEAEHGIHWHINLTNKVEYFAADARRQVIPWVRLTDPLGNVTVYRSPDYKAEPEPAQIRRMDCLDCHNRSGHHFYTPNESVDVALAHGALDRTLPWLKSNVVAALVAPYSTEPEAMQGIADRLLSAYRDSPKAQEIVAETQRIYRQSLFAEMKTDWRAYPDHIGHKDWPGCFRCHDGNHKTADGQRSIGGSECKSCHIILAQGSGADLDKLDPRGHTFFHIDSEYTDFSCNNCHNGALME